MDNPKNKLFFRFRVIPPHACNIWIMYCHYGNHQIAIIEPNKPQCVSTIFGVMASAPFQRWHASTCLAESRGEYLGGWLSHANIEFPTSHKGSGSWLFRWPLKTLKAGLTKPFRLRVTSVGKKNWWYSNAVARTLFNYPVKCVTRAPWRSSPFWWNNLLSGLKQEKTPSCPPALNFMFLISLCSQGHSPPPPPLVFSTRQALKGTRHLFSDALTLFLLEFHVPRNPIKTTMIFIAPPVKKKKKKKEKNALTHTVSVR